MSYKITREKFKETYLELEPLYRQHYSEMVERLEADGVEDYSPYNPRLDEYVRASEGGWLLTFVLRLDGKACGYSNVYLTNDMHNQDLIAQEDTIFVLKEHRNGVGKQMVRHILEELRQLGVKRVLVSALTDLRVAKLWRRMGFKDVATQMIYKF
jgi:ribosomal protein S18 acetylase RimI-like enzyme